MAIHEIQTIKFIRLIKLLFVNLMFISIITIIVNSYFYIFKLNYTWIEPWSVQIVSNDDKLYIFTQINKMVRLRGLFISAPTRPVDVFNYLIIISTKPENKNNINVLDIKKMNTGISINPRISEIFCINECIYMRIRSNSGTIPSLYEFREGKFNIVSGGLADKFPQKAESGLGQSLPNVYSHHRGGHLLDLTQDWSTDNVFEFNKYKYIIEKKRDSIILYRSANSSPDKPSRQSVDQSVLLPCGIVFRYSTKGG